MLQIKVFQNGVNRIYATNSFNKTVGNKSEIVNFMYEMAKVDNGLRKMISFEDAMTKAYIFVSPVACLIEFEKGPKKTTIPKRY